MTPMVDLAFLLLTFFVLTSNLHKPNAIEVAFPIDGPTSPLYEGFANTVLIDDGKIYFYSGKLMPDGENVSEVTLDENGIRRVIREKNADIQGQMNFVQGVFDGASFTREDYDRIESYLQQATASKDNEAQVVKDLKEENYSACIALMDADLAGGRLSDETVTKIGSTLRNTDEAPFFIVKWGENAKYEDVIAVIDELKIGQVSKYAITTVSVVENELVLHHNENTGNGTAK